MTTGGGLNLHPVLSPTDPEEDHQPSRLSRGGSTHNDPVQYALNVFRQVNTCPVYTHVESPNMASDSDAPSQSRPAASTRTHTGLENLLPASITKRSRSSSRSRPSRTPQLERSVSSMTDSFMLEHWGSSSHTPPTEADGATTLKALIAKDEDGLTPISNWAHLSYIKNQRNVLRGELKAHQIAGAEAKRSVTSLRRLAFRMAINISVKEKQIATTAKNLARNRKTSYLEERDAQRRIQDLTRALRIEEGRNQEILEALEKASMLTLQCEQVAP